MKQHLKYWLCIFMVVLCIVPNISQSTCYADDRCEVQPQVQAGGSFGIYLGRNGTVWTWGDNSQGQLGIGQEMELSLAPVQVIGLTEVVQVSAGLNHGVALKRDGTVWTWGRNDRGQLGTGSFQGKNDPVQVKGEEGVGYLQNIVSVCAGREHNLALDAAGRIWGWGRNSQGELGAHDTNVTTPVYINELEGVQAVCAGTNFSAAIIDGQVWAWGSNSFGQLGCSESDKSPVPLPVESLENVLALSLGDAHVLALMQDGGIQAWGRNASGQLGNYSTTDRSTPGSVSGIIDAVSISAGSDYSMAVDAQGNLWAWGNNAFSGKLGIGESDGRKTYPVQVNSIVSEMPGTSQVSAGNFFTLALDADGALMGCGANSYGQLGDGTQNASTVFISGLVTVSPVYLDSSPSHLQEDVPVDQVITLIFDKEIEPGLEFDQIAAVGCDGKSSALEKDMNGSKLILQAVSALNWETTYTVTVPGNAVQDLAGNPLANVVSIHFKTVVKPDMTPPVIHSFTINEGAAVTRNRQVLLQVDAEDDRTDREDLRLRFSNQEDAEWGEWESYVTEQWWDLDPGDGVKTVYINVKDQSGNLASSRASILLDTTPPKIVNTAPLNNEEDVSVDQLISATFSEDITAGEHIDQVKVEKNQQGVWVNVEMNPCVHGKTLTLLPTKTLNHCTNYRVIIPAGAVQDLAENPLIQVHQWNFITEPFPVIEPEPQPCNNAYLRYLGVSEGEMVTGFVYNVYEYRVDLCYDISEITVTADTSSNEASVAINSASFLPGEDASMNMELIVGENAVMVSVTAEDGETVLEYLLTIVREKPTDLIPPPDPEPDPDPHPDPSDPDPEPGPLPDPLPDPDPDPTPRTRGSRSGSDNDTDEFVLETKEIQEWFSAWGHYFYSISPTWRWIMESLEHFI